MSWWVMEERYDSVVHAIHEVGEYGGVRGGALSRWEEGEVLFTKASHLRRGNIDGMEISSPGGSQDW